MNALPTVELHVRCMEEEVLHAVMMRRDEIAQYIEEGVKRAVEHAPQAIIDAAMEKATKAISVQVENYFRYGPGAKAIEKAIQKALAPIAAALSK